MTPDASQWRMSAHYDHVDDLTASDLAWEWLRRNEDYGHDYETLASEAADSKTLIERIRRHWGLRFPDRSPARSTWRPGLLAAAARHQRRRARDHATRASIH